MKFEQRTGGFPFTGKISAAMSRPRNLPPNQQMPAFPKKISCAALTDKLCQREACHFYLTKTSEKAHGAPVAWEKPNRTTPRNEPDMTGKFQTRQKQKPRTTHFHIFESLPGLNGFAHNGRGDDELING